MDQQMSETEQPPAAGASKPTTTIQAEDVKVLLNSLSTGHFYFGEGGAARTKSLEDLAEDLPNYPPNLHLFRDHRHDQLLSELEQRRILLLTSYQESAAYAAAYSLVSDDHFLDKKKRALFPTRGR